MSRSVSEKIQRWPAGSSASYCRSPYSKSVGSGRAVRAGVLAVRAGVVDAHQHGVRLLAGARRSPLVAHVADDQASVAEPELRAVVLADPHALLEPERGREPLDRLTDIRIHEHRDDGR